MSLESSYLLNMEGLPRFSNIKVPEIKNAVEQQIAECRKMVISTVEKLKESGCYTYDNLVKPISEVEDKLNRMWSPISHLNSVMNTDELRNAHDSCLPALSAYSTFVGQYKDLYDAYKKLQESDNFENLDEARKQEISNTMRDFRLSGISLSPEKQKRFGELESRLSELSSLFSNHIMDSNLNWYKHITDKDELRGLPDSALALAQQNAQERQLQGYVLTLDIPSYFPVMQYADSADLRRECYEAYVTRASELGPNAGKWDNRPLIDEILKLRHEEAELLGFNNYAQLSLATKMADNTDEVMTFLQDLAKRAYKQGTEEFQEIKEFAKSEYGIESLESWDIAYYSEKLKIKKYNTSEEKLRIYFPFSRVLKGLFETVYRVFGLTVKEHQGTVDLYHKDVRFYDVFDKCGDLRGSFYLDPYARAHKRGGAWMDECLPLRKKQDGTWQRPVAYIVCNFNPPIGDSDALLTHSEVVTIFHEFGHGLNLMLTTVEADGVSGINGVAWDAVELPSQFLENWCWEKDALRFISGHVETGEPLPEEELKRLIDGKNYHSAMFLLRQLEFGLMDFKLHLDYDEEQGSRVREIIADVRKAVSVVPVPSFNRFEDSFSHVFSGGYAAGYYSYLWAELLSADAFSRFEEEGIFNQQVGADFMHCILEKGGSVPAMQQFVAFRGREPKIDAMLRHMGIN